MTHDATYADSHLSLGFGDPGGLNPITGGPPNPVTDRWYDMLPETYRAADEQDTSTADGWPLYAYMDAACSVLVTPTGIADRIADGDLTDPSLADDGWVPWLAQAVGVNEITVAAMRTALANIISAAALGSRDYVRVLTQGFLIDTRDCEVTAVPPWGIRVRVRASEISPSVGGDTTGLTAALYATGKVPAGFALQVTTMQQTWGQVQSALPTWAPGEGKPWSTVESMGLAGAGASVGGVSWAGAAVGDAP